MKHFLKLKLSRLEILIESKLKSHIDRYEICYLVSLKPNPNQGIIETYDFYFLFCSKPHRTKAMVLLTLNSCFSKLFKRDLLAYVNKPFVCQKFNINRIFTQRN